MYSCAVCSEAEPACSAAMSRGWKPAPASKIRVYSRMRNNTSKMCTLRIAPMGHWPVWVRSARPPDRDFRFIDARERRQTPLELACLLGQQQNDLRGEDTGEPAHDPISASRVSQLILHSTQTPSGGGKHGHSAAEGERDRDP